VQFAYLQFLAESCQIQSLSVQPRDFFQVRSSLTNFSQENYTIAIEQIQQMNYVSNWIFPKLNFIIT
jgi:hypothetical protein